MDEINFVHLHTHTEYSTLDGMGKVEELFQRAKELGQPALACTDHGSTSALWVAQKMGEKYGVKAILGTEFYYQRENDDANGHLIVLAKNDKGLENIFKLQEFAYVDNFYKKPRINWQKLIEHKEGLIVCSACLASTFAQYIMNGQFGEAREWAKKFKEEFGEDFYIEIQPNSIPEQYNVNSTSIRIAKQLGIKVVATNDVHYVLKDDWYAHEVLLALQVNKKMDDEKRFRFSTQDFWLKSKEEMLDTFIGIDKQDIVDAMNNTIEVMEKCNASIKIGHYLPEYYNIPKGETPRSILAKEIMQGAKRTGKIKDRDYMVETQNELDVIDRNGYSGYFLIVQDYVNSARNNGNIVGDGRGSGAGSKVAYLTDITRIEPKTYDLLFERFMADGRTPDFDVDFSDQDGVFADLQSKYGEENVARIIAFGTLTPKAVCRKVFSAFGHGMAEINKISKLVPDLCQRLSDAYKASPELLRYKKTYQKEFEIIERLEGIVSHESQHAGGVLIYPNLSSILPVKTKAEDRTKRIVAFDKYMIEELGHYKFDILGLETLPIIKRTLDYIKQSKGLDIDLYKINLNDKNIYEMLCSGDVSGVFQLANQAQKVMEQQPGDFKDLIAINALIRPGVGNWEEYIARRKGKKWTVYDLRMPYMKETVGTMTYQEQFLLDCKILAGWSIAFADKKVRKNKNIREDVELHQKFINDAIERGNDKIEMEKVWKEIEDAVDGGYSFNKSHSASYAVLSFQTAWLKYYYPAEFYASLMSSEKTDGDGQSAISGYITECKQRGIKMLPPDINNSGDNFIVTDEGIGYKITTITNVGDSAIEGIEKMRPVKSFQDFLERKEKKSVKKNVVINLIKAGCFDFDNPNRAELMWEFEMSQRNKTQIKEEHQCFKYNWNDKLKSKWENEALGVYLTVHPLERYGFKTLDTFKDGETALQGGEIYELKVFKDKKQNEMAFVWINTLFGNLKILVFSSMWTREEVRNAMQKGNIIMVKGTRSGNDILLSKVEVLEEV